MNTPRQICDAVPFYTELDLLEARIDYLKGVVDLFIIVECDRNHANKPVEMQFLKHRDRFTTLFPDVKIHHVMVNDISHGVSNWPRVNEHRNAITRGLTPKGRNVWETTNDGRGAWRNFGVGNDGPESEVPDDAIVLISDLDEFPPREYLKALKNGHLNVEAQTVEGKPIMVNLLNVLHHGKVFRFEGAFYYYDLYTRNANGWGNSRVALAASVRHFSPECIRRAGMRCGCGIGPNGEMCHCECAFFGGIPGGWHFSYFGGPEMVKQKIESIAESAFLATPDFTDPDKIRARMVGGGDLYDRGNEKWERLDRVPVDIPDEVVKRFPGRAENGYKLVPPLGGGSV